MMVTRVLQRAESNMMNAIDLSFFQTLPGNFPQTTVGTPHCTAIKKMLQGLYSLRGKTS